MHIAPSPIAAFATMHHDIEHISPMVSNPVNSLFIMMTIPFGLLKVLFVTFGGFLLQYFPLNLPQNAKMDIVIKVSVEEIEMPINEVSPNMMKI